MSAWLTRLRSIDHREPPAALALRHEPASLVHDEPQCEAECKPDIVSDMKPPAAPSPASKPPPPVARLRPSDWPPKCGPGVTITAPAVEVGAREYDAHLDAMISALPEGSVERNRLAFAKRKGWVTDRGADRIFTRGRT